MDQDQVQQITAITTPLVEAEARERRDQDQKLHDRVNGIDKAQEVSRVKYDEQMRSLNAWMKDLAEEVSSMRKAVVAAAITFALSAIGFALSVLILLSKQA